MINLEHLQQLYKKWAYGEINDAVMADTKEHCETNPKLIDSIGKSIDSCLIVYAENNIDISPKPWNTKIIVSNKRSFEAAKSYKWKKVAVLDFANNRYPWWAPYRDCAQEECLCRCSTLYLCLSWWDNYNLFYQRHIDLYNHWEISLKWNDDLMYFHNITVFKSDEDIPQLMNEKERYNVDVIVSAAPELHSWDDYWEEEFEASLNSRIKRILDIAYKKKVEVLILWAYGCWAFHNPPQLVAKIFKDNLKNYDFEIVEFPIFHRNEYWYENYEAFLNIFKLN